MAQRFFLSLPVKDIARSRAFFAALGHEFDPQFTGDEAVCLTISDTASVMMLTCERYAQLCTKEIADTQKTSAALISLALGSRAAVDAHLDAAVQAGGAEAGEREDMGFMYSGGFYDLDGHGWGICWMNPEAAMPSDAPAGEAT